MAEFHEAVLTKKGIMLLAKAQAENKTIQITKAVTGNGTYGDDEDLSSMTGLKSQQQEFMPTTIKRQNETNVFVHFTITNFDGTTGLTHGYYVSEIGLIANDPDEGEILYAIATGVDGRCDFLQAYNDLLLATIGVDFLIEVGNADNVTITTDLSVYASKEDLDSKGDTLSYDKNTGSLSLKANGKEISSVTIMEKGSIGNLAGEDDVRKMARALMERFGEPPEESGSRQPQMMKWRR